MNMRTKRLLPLAALVTLLAAGPDKAGAVPLLPTKVKPREKVKEVIGAPDPGTLGAYRNRVGQTFYFQVTGAVAGTIWGTGIYTDDSALATTAIHAGVLRAGQTAFVKVTIVAGQATYIGSTQNNITSHPYQAWQGSYRVEPVDPRVRVKLGGQGEKK
jgi:hypothetical protein